MKLKFFSLSFFFVTLFVGSVFAGHTSCGNVTILQILTGPSHGAMMRVSNPSCGSSGWVCLDPNGEYLSQKESDRLFSHMLTTKLENSPIHLTVYDDKFPIACGGNYPVAYDARTAQ